MVVIGSEQDNSIVEDKDVAFIEKSQFENAMETSLQPLITMLLKVIYQRMMNNIKTLNDLSEDSFICTEEDNIWTLSLSDEEIVMLNGIFTFEEVNPALSYPILDTLPKGALLARVKEIEGMADKVPLNDP